MIKIDGVEFAKAVISIKRNFQVTDGDLAGRVLTADMARDVQGTFYNYSATVDSSFMTLEEYDTLYEIISSPDDFHTMEAPYAQGAYTYQAYITNGSDELRLMKDGKNYWGNLSFNFIAKSPKRRPA